MDPSRGDSRYNLNYSMSSIGLSLADQADLYGNPAAAAALGGGRPPSGGLLQSMGGGGGNGGMPGGRSSGGLMSNAGQCQSLGGNSAGVGGGGGPNSVQTRGIKRTNSGCYDDHHRVGGGGGGGVSGSSGMTSQTLQGLESCAGGGSNPGQQQQQQQQQGNVVPDGIVDDSYSSLQNKKSPPANGKKTKGRVKIKMEYIDNKLRRYTTFSKRKTGIMKKAYELSTLTGTQVMLLVASETGHVYTFATRKLQPMITSEAGKQLIQTCLNSPDPPSVGGGDQRMSATGFEETELSYNIADEDSKDDRSPMSSGNESDDSSDVESPGPPSLKSSQSMLTAAGVVAKDSREASTSSSAANGSNHQNPSTSLQQHTSRTVNAADSMFYQQHASSSAGGASGGGGGISGTGNAFNNVIYPAAALSNIPQEVLLGLIQSGHLQLHTEEDGSGHQYVTIPLSMAAAASSVSSSIGPSSTVTNTSNSFIASNATPAKDNRIHVKDLSARSSSSNHPHHPHQSSQLQQHHQSLQFDNSAGSSQPSSSTVSSSKDNVRIKQELLTD